MKSDGEARADKINELQSHVLDNQPSAELQSYIARDALAIRQTLPFLKKPQQSALKLNDSPDHRADDRRWSATNIP